MSSISLKIKIILMCLGLSIITLVVGVFSLFNLKKVISNYRHVTEINLQNALILSEMDSSVNKLRIAGLRSGVHGLGKEVLEQEHKNAVELVEKYEAADKKYQSVDFVEGEENLYKPVSESWKKLRDIELEVIKLNLEGSEKNEEKIKEIYSIQIPEYSNEMLKNLEALINFQSNESHTWSSRAEEVSKRTEFLTYVLLVLSQVVAISIGVLFSAKLMKSLTSITESITDSSSHVSSASAQISSSSEEMSSTSTQQAAAVQETATSIDQMNAMVAKNTQLSKESETISEESYQIVLRGKNSVEMVKNSINEISNSSNELVNQVNVSNEELSQTVNIIKEIGVKTKIINDIVFQTKLLSFNASVEAARAGEHGKGFAVVAEEIGSLASMSGTAAKEISELLEQSISKVEHTVENSKSSIVRIVDATKAKVEDGSKMSEDCSKILDEVVVKVNDVRQKMSEISTASEEQSKGISEVSRAINEINSGIQQGVVATQQSASAAVQLNSQAEGLNHLVLDLKKVMLGRAA